jgi:hypothetical protein
MADSVSLMIACQQTLSAVQRLRRRRVRGNAAMRGPASMTAGQNEVPLSDANVERPGAAKSDGGKDWP